MTGRQKGRKYNAAQCSIYRLTDTFPERERLTAPGAQR